MVLMKLLATIESSNNEVSAVTLARKLDLLSAISLIEDAWSFISPAIIVNCFRKAKFYEDNLITVPEQNIIPLPNELDFDFEQFVSIDENIDCFEPIDENNNIIENINGRRNEISVEEDSLKSFECEEKK